MIRHNTPIFFLQFLCSCFHGYQINNESFDTEDFLIYTRLKYMNKVSTDFPYAFVISFEYFEIILDFTFKFYI